jgi:hypothetical protein
MRNAKRFPPLGITSRPIVTGERQMSRLNYTITHERLKELLHYDEVTGVFTRKIDTGKRWKAGMEAGFFHASRKYWYVSINGHQYLAHRLAWFYVHGEWPKDDIDHKRGKEAGNGIENLRDGSTLMNCQNRRVAQKNNASGYLGVSKIRGSWRARITVNQRTVDLGCFGSPEEAHNAYLSAKRKLHNGCTI